MLKLTIENVGQIQDAKLEFGDLTVFVGPQATGKSVALQLLKLVIDAGHVQEEMRRHGLDWSGKLSEFLDVYLGEGMRSVWTEKSRICWKGKLVGLGKIAERKQRAQRERLFFIPAQRVLALRDGWPRPFTDYSPGDPFAVREFSEKLRVLVEQEFAGESLFPQERRLKKEFRDLLERNVFANFSLKVDKVRSQKRLVLGVGDREENLPYMVWSAGQREFVPLLLGMYWLMPPSKISQRAEIEWVVLEELEMGLHPRAIAVVMLMVFELMARGYRVCLSTHSPQVLEAVWALQRLKKHEADATSLLRIFKVDPKKGPMRELAKTVLGKDIKVHYFDRESGTARDISNLDPGAEQEGESGWGGLSEFSGRANEEVASAVANSVA